MKIRHLAAGAALITVVSVTPLAFAEDSVATVPTPKAVPAVTATTPTVAPRVLSVTKAVPKAVPKPQTFTKAQIRYLSILHVNNTRYNHGDPKPAMATFRIVASQRGWTPKQIQSWEIAVANIMMGESGFCPNVLGGARMANPKGCVIGRQGTRSDAGFGQLISLNYKISSTNPGAGWLCKEEGLCSKWAIIASPWNSMTALVALIERSGVFPWCYNSWARSYHRPACNNPGIDVP